ncbi:lysophospholipid acyltransferase family protein [Lysobacter sp. A3-1-A15]|uniref:lysophospholipid acyltransferase family protein n=1 Tax=Novilysobacter viscosus TaxID=3098602 RepID=UPI002ED8DC9E
MGLSAPPPHPPGGARVLPLPPRVPRAGHHPLTRWMGLTALRLGGWRMVGALPDVPKAVLIGAPHSTNWDGIWGFSAKAAMDLDLTVLGKHSLFRVPLLGAMLRAFGVIPVDRSAARGVVEQAAGRVIDAERLWIGLAPEGTRRRVERWKPGFWKIARAAGVPVVPAYFHYPDKVIGIGPPFELTDDMEADLARIREWYRPWQGKYHGTP